MRTRLAASLCLIGGSLGLLWGPSPPEAGAGKSPLGPPLRLRATFPGEGVLEVLTDPVVLRFSRPVDLATVDGASFRVDAGPTTLPGTYAHGTTRRGRLDPRQVVFTPAAPLPANRAVRVRVSLDLRSDRGRALDDGIDFTFLTHAGKSVTGVTPLPAKFRMVRAPRLGPPPRVKWTFPLAGLGNVFSDEVRIRFNREMDTSTIDGTSFSLTSGGRTVPGTVTAAASGDPREILFEPTAPLFPDSTFEMRVTRAVRTRRGASLREEFRAAFGTSPFKDGVRPLHPEDFTPGPDLLVGRAFHTGSPLDSGDVLIAGGESVPGVPTAVTEIFRRGTASMVRTADLATARRKHAAVVLKNGRVLVCGGFGPTGATLSSVEIFDPVAGTWSSPDPMAGSRAHHTATLLQSGRVLVAGGFTNDAGPLDYQPTAEIFDPGPGTWTPAGNLFWRRGGHTATLLSDGRVLLAGGERLQQPVAELYVPATGTFRETLGKPRESRLFHAAAVVRQGSVLLAGGGPPEAERFDLPAETFTVSGSSPPFGLPVSESPWYPSLTTISGGRSALLGGLSLGGAGGGGNLVLSQIQLWDSRGGGGQGAFYPMIFTMEVPRAAHTVTPLGDGRFLVAGGLGTEGPTNERRTSVLLPSQ